MSAVVTSQERGERGAVMLTPSGVNCRVAVCGVGRWMMDDAIPFYPFRDEQCRSRIQNMRKQMTNLSCHLGAHVVDAEGELEEPVPEAVGREEAEDVAELERHGARRVDEREDDGGDGEDQALFCVYVRVCCCCLRCRWGVSVNGFWRKNRNKNRIVP